MTLFFLSESAQNAVLQKAIAGCSWSENPETEIDDAIQTSAAAVEFIHETELTWLNIQTCGPYFVSHAWTAIDRQLDDSQSNISIGQYAVHRFVLASDAAAELNSAILSSYTQQASAAPGIQASNIGGWHSDRDSLQTGPLRSTKFGEMLSAVGSSVERAESERTGRRVGIIPPCTECWVNVSRGWDHNSLHNHPGATFSGERSPFREKAREATDSARGSLIS